MVVTICPFTKICLRRKSNPTTKQMTQQQKLETEIEVPPLKCHQKAPKNGTFLEHFSVPFFGLVKLQSVMVISVQNRLQKWANKWALKFSEITDTARERMLQKQIPVVISFQNSPIFGGTWGVAPLFRSLKKKGPELFSQTPQTIIRQGARIDVQKHWFTLQIYHCLNTVIIYK